MSATTILESYDTQMDYSGDFDVAMHTAASTSDTWPYQSETIMDQDAHHESRSTGAADRESVEVDMEETYPDHTDHESVEYEMVDEEAIYPHEGGDLLDVEVYDASRLQSPAPMPAAIDTPQMASGELVDFTIHTTPVFTDPHNSVEASTVLQQETHIHDHPVDELPAVETIPNTSPRFEVHEEPSDPVVALSQSHAEHLADPFNDGRVIADHPPHAALRTKVTAEVAEASNSAVTHVEDASRAHHAEIELAPAWSHSQDHETAAYLDQPTESEHPGSEEYPGEAHQYYDSNETAANAVDPHEISEGVYIDPPPPVLLSLPSSDQPDICLFNQPPARGGSSSPSEETHQPGQQVLTLLLHHRPTLYYESLTNVFEALRQEEYITRIPEFAEGELALDAYDLQLVVSEDNTHAREVTLHDLNVLHDGSDLSGPLRLRLHVIVPRFILRYHMLRDQIARLNLVAEGGEEGEQIPTHYDLHAEEYHDADEYHPENAPPEGNNKEHQGQRLDQQYNESSADRIPPPDQTEQATGDISNLTTEDHNYQQVNGKEAQDFGDENEYTDANDDTGADIDHNNSAAADDPESAGYEDYTEQAEYDERYGEVHDGDDVGLDGNQASGYHEAADDQAPTDVDNAQEALLEPEIIDPASAVDLAEATGDHPAEEEDHFSEGVVEETFKETNKTDAEASSQDNHDHASVGTAIKQDVPGVDESDSNFVAILEHEADLTDPEAEGLASTSDPQKLQEPELGYPEFGDDQEWDDDLDAEGEIDVTWPVDHDDDVSNQSSTTLSSTTSTAKRGYDELNSEDELDGDSHPPQKSSPEPKRPRVA